MSQSSLKRFSLVLALGASFALHGALARADIGPRFRVEEASGAGPASALANQAPLLRFAQDDGGEYVEEPAYEEPVYEEPAYEEPIVEEPTYEEPAYEEPPVEEPVYEEPAYEEPQFEESIVDEPAYEEPQAEEPAYEEPVDEEPAYEEPIPEESFEEEPFVEEEPLSDELPAEEPFVEEELPVEDELIEDEPLQDDGAAIEGEDDSEGVSEDGFGLTDEGIEEPVSEEELVEDGAGDPDSGEVAGEDSAVDADGGEDGDLAGEEAELLEDAPAEAEAAEDVLADEGIAEEELEAADVAAEVEAAASEEPELNEEGEIVEAIADLDGASPEDVAPLFDSAKSGEGEEVPADEVSEAEPPLSDEETQAFETPAEFGAERFAEGEDLAEAPEFDLPGDVTIIVNESNTYVYETNETLIVNNYAAYNERITDYGYSELYYQQLDGGYYEESAYADDGTVILTVYDAYGNVIERTYYDADGNPYVLAWYDVSYGPISYEDVGLGLPPLPRAFPASYYVLNYDEADANSIYRFLARPPVERARRLYSIDEVKRSARLRDTLPRVEIGNLGFATGSAKVGRAEARTLKAMAAAMLKQIRANPAETYLIEGHTDAVGGNRDNLVLSDRRAQAVAQALTRYYGVPAQNLYTQGYGEQFLKVRTNGPSAPNRRVTVRRTTPLVTPVASR